MANVKTKCRKSKTISTRLVCLRNIKRPIRPGLFTSISALFMLKHWVNTQNMQERRNPRKMKLDEPLEVERAHSVNGTVREGADVAGK